MNQAFDDYKHSFKEMVDGGVEGVARERQRLEDVTKETVGEVDRLDDRLRDRTVGVVSLTLLVTVVAVGVIVVAGGLWMGASLLGIPVAVPEMWSRAWTADTWWAGVGWAMGAITLTLTTIVAVAVAAAWVGKRWLGEDFREIMQHNRR